MSRSRRRSDQMGERDIMRSHRIISVKVRWIKTRRADGEMYNDTKGVN